MMVVLQGRAEARQKMFNHLKQKGDMTQVRKGVTMEIGEVLYCGRV